MITVVLDV